MIRLGTVGTSAITAHFLAGAAKTNQFVHTAIYSRQEATGRAFAQTHTGAAVFTSLTAMAQSGIDAVYIASPNVLHAAQARVFLEHGVHVLCEKPLVTDPADYQALKALADQKGLVYMEAIIPYHTPAHAVVKDALAAVGSIAAVRIDYCQRSSRLDAFYAGQPVNIFDMSLHAGALMDIGVYCVYSCVDLFGMPQSITAGASYLSNGADGSGCAVFHYPAFSAVLTYSKTGQSTIGSEIVGDRGSLKIRMISQYTEVSLVQDGQETPLVGNVDKATLMSGEAQRFADYIGGAPDALADYAAASKLCQDVHQCMHRIKTTAGIHYPAQP